MMVVQGKRCKSKIDGCGGGDDSSDGSSGGGIGCGGGRGGGRGRGDGFGCGHGGGDDGGCGCELALDLSMGMPVTKGLGGVSDSGSMAVAVVARGSDRATQGWTRSSDPLRV